MRKRHGYLSSKTATGTYKLRSRKEKVCGPEVFVCRTPPGIHENATCVQVALCDQGHRDMVLNIHRERHHMNRSPSTPV
jgi:hypothetical protein